MNSGNIESLRLNLESQIQTAQQHFEARRIAAAERCLIFPTIQTREQHPDLFQKWKTIKDAVDQHKINAYLYKYIPIEFHSIDASLYPSPQSLSEALAFQPGPYDQISGQPAPGYKGGLLLYGQTGAGKTRAAFAVLSARCHEDANRRFRYVSAPILKRQLADAARGGRSQVVLEELLEDTFATLFIDDLSQARFTPAFAENLFELVDRIHREHVDLIVTVQTTGCALVRKWCADDKDLEDTSYAIARRLREYCHVVRFAPEKPHQGPAALRLANEGVGEGTPKGISS